MNNRRTILFKILTRLLGFVIFIAISQSLLAQSPTDSLPPDPGSIAVYTVQNLNFGAFISNTGGTVIMSSEGGRSVTGAVVAVNMGTYFQSIFEIDAPQGTIISILNGPNATLTGSVGGSMTLSLGSSNPTSPFTTTATYPARTQVNIGGTLTVPASSPAGNYAGSFSITFNYE